MNKIQKIHPKYQKSESGFSLIEIVAVMGILGIIMTIGSMSFASSTEKLALDQAQANILFALEEAQNRAATGFGTGNHGVRINGNEIIIFEGDTYNTNVKEEVISLLNVSTDQTGLDIIFERIKATTTANTIIISHTNGSTKTINITSNGKISTQ